MSRFKHPTYEKWIIFDYKLGTVIAIFSCLTSPSSILRIFLLLLPLSPVLLTNKRVTDNPHHHHLHYMCLELGAIIINKITFQYRKVLMIKVLMSIDSESLYD